MVYFSVAGTTHHGLRNKNEAQLKAITAVRLAPEPTNKFDKRAIAIYLKDDTDTYIQAGYVPSLQLEHAHREKWAEREWQIHEIGRWTPPYSRTDLVFCKIADTEAHIVDSPKRGRISMKQRIKQDDTLYDGKTCVSIYYASKSTGLYWRDVVLKTKTGSSFFACDGTKDKNGRLIPQKEFKFAQLDDAAELPEWEVEATDIEDPRAKRAKVE